MPQFLAAPDGQLGQKKAQNCTETPPKEIAAAVAGVGYDFGRCLWGRRCHDHRNRRGALVLERSLVVLLQRHGNDQHDRDYNLSALFTFYVLARIVVLLRTMVAT
jgi:hypothetical protein